MPRHSVNISDQQAAFIRGSVDSGEFRDASDVVSAALRLLARQQEEDRLKLEHLRRLATEGFEELDRGDYVTCTRDTLGDFFSQIDRRVRTRAKRTQRKDGR